MPCIIFFEIPQWILGAKPSHEIINDQNPEFGPRIPPPPPPTLPSEERPTNEILAETIQRLRRNLEEETRKNKDFEEKNEKLRKEKETLRITVHQQEKRIERLTNKEVSIPEKKKIVREMLSETKFTPVTCSIFTSII